MQEMKYRELEQRAIPAPEGPNASSGRVGSLGAERWAEVRTTKLTSWLLLLPLLFSLAGSPDLARAAEKEKPAVAATEPVKGVTVTVAQLILLGQTDTLAKLSAQDLPALAAFRINRFVAALTPEIQRALKARRDLFTDGNSDPTPGQTGSRTSKPDKVEEFVKAQTPLLEEKVTVAITPLSLDEDLPGVKLASRDIDALGALLKKP